MTGAEWFESYAIASSNGLTAMAILLTMVSGYMGIAFLVGERLSTVQVGLANFVYILASTSVLLSNYGSVMDSATARTEAALLIQQLKPIVDTSASPEVMALTVAGINALFIVISLIFMWQVRHPRTGLYSDSEQRE